MYDVELLTIILVMAQDMSKQLAHEGNYCLLDGASRSLVSFYDVRVQRRACLSQDMIPNEALKLH